MKPLLSNDPNFYGYNFTRWIMRVGVHRNADSGVTTVNQSFEIIGDSKFNATSAAARTFAIVIRPDRRPAHLHPDQRPVQPRRYVPAGTRSARISTTRPRALRTRSRASLYAAGNASTTGTAGTAWSIPFQLDGRWLHAFNGPGMGSSASTAHGCVQLRPTATLRY